MPALFRIVSIPLFIQWSAEIEEFDFEKKNHFLSLFYQDIIENYESALYFSFENAPLEKIDAVYEKMQTTLEKIGSGEEKFDMNRMQNILERSILEYYSNLESNPHEAIAFASIADSLYGEKSEDVSRFIYFINFESSWIWYLMHALCYIYSFKCDWTLTNKWSHC